MKDYENEHMYPDFFGVECGVHFYALGIGIINTESTIDKDSILCSAMRKLSKRVLVNAEKDQCLKLTAIKDIVDMIQGTCGDANAAKDKAISAMETVGAANPHTVDYMYLKDAIMNVVQYIKAPVFRRYIDAYDILNAAASWCLDDTLSTAITSAFEATTPEEWDVAVFREYAARLEALASAARKVFG